MNITHGPKAAFDSKSNGATLGNAGIAACKTSARTFRCWQNLSEGQSAKLAEGPKSNLAQQICEATGGNGRAQ